VVNREGTAPGSGAGAAAAHHQRSPASGEHAVLVVVLDFPVLGVSGAGERKPTEAERSATEPAATLVLVAVPL
jgi:hypothetical protein